MMRSAARDSFRIALTRMRCAARTRATRAARTRAGTAKERRAQRQNLDAATCATPLDARLRYLLRLIPLVGDLACKKKKKKGRADAAANSSTHSVIRYQRT